MLKRYFSWQLKRWWPFFLIFGVVLTLVYVGFASLNGVTYQLRTIEGRAVFIGNSVFESGLITFCVFSLIASFVMPVFVFSYRTSRRQTDILYQAAYSPTTIKRTRILLGAIILAASFTVAYFFGVSIYLIRYVATPESLTIASGVTQMRQEAHFIWYLPSYFLLLTVMLAQYSINCFLVSLGNYVLDQIFLLIAGNLFLSLFVVAPLVLIQASWPSSLETPYSLLWQGMLYGFGVVQPNAFISLIVDPLFKYGRYNNFDGGSINALISFLLYLAFAGGITYLNMKLKDPSGEKADKAGPANNVIALIPHGFAICAGMLVAALARATNGTVLLPTAMIFGYGMYCAVYYALLALWRHSFKPTKIDLACYLSICGATLISELFAFAISAI